MTEAIIYDAVRTPRGRGKPDGSLHTATTLQLAATALRAIKDRNHLDKGEVDDVVLGCVDAVGEAGGDIARMGALAAGFGDSVPGIQINRFCASGLDAVNFAAAQVMSGQHDLTIGGGVESMSRIGLGAAGGAWPVDPALAIPAYFMPQGISADLIATKYGFSRDDVDAYAVQSQKRAAAAWADGRFKHSIAPVRDVNGISLLDNDEHMRPNTDMQSLASLKPSFVMMGEQGGFDTVATQAHPEVERVIHVHHAGNSSGIVDGAAAGGGRQGGVEAARPHPRVREYRHRARDHVDRPGRRDAQGARARGDDDRRHRLVRGQRGLRGSRSAVPSGVRSRHIARQRQRRRHRDGPSARRQRRDAFGDRARRIGAHRQVNGADHALYRRRHGHGDDHRACLSSARRKPRRR